MKRKIDIAMSNPGTLGIIAGSGDIPSRLAEACAKAGRDCFVLMFEGNPVAESLSTIPHAKIRIGAVGEAFAALHAAGVSEVTLAGRITRPSLANLRPDATAAKLLARIGTSYFGGDDKLLKTVIGFLEEEGFKVIGADEILGDILAPLGPLGKILPDKKAQADIKLGVKVAKALGALDVGQAVIVQRQMVLGVEAVEGTDALIARCAHLRPEGTGGVLIKVKKPGQERRVDLPAVGVATLENLHRAGFVGIAVEAGASLVIDRKEVAKRADALGLFILGFTLD